MTRPSSLSSSYRLSRPSYWGVRPQALAVLTTSTTWPAYSERWRSWPVRVVAVKSERVVMGQSSHGAPTAPHRVTVTFDKRLPGIPCRGARSPRHLAGDPDRAGRPDRGRGATRPTTRRRRARGGRRHRGDRRGVPPGPARPPRHL